MIKQFIHILIFSLLSISFCATAQQKGQNKETKAPVIKFEKSTHDFGTIEKNDYEEFEFLFKNTGNEPLILSDVIPSCGCTIPSWTKEPIMPGKSGGIKIRYNATSTGSFKKTITVISNATEDRVTLTIKGNTPS